MEDIWFNICSMLLIFTVAIISPGPNFIFVVNRSLSDSRRTGLYSALGVATGSGIFAIAGLLGLIVLISTLPYFSTLIRYLGGGYLIYLGISTLLSCRQQMVSTNPTNSGLSISAKAAYYTGLLTNLTNPKAWAFYLSLFTLMIENHFPLWAKIFLAISMFLISFSWYALMALVISDRRVQGNFLRLQPLIKSVLGCMLILLGGKLLKG
ncbi:resistance to homoserine/threonine (RhtB) family protein [Malonomonas rubra DSM 5091]|uniref:Resistance to homoserine/threonine (RhtB) family protein n=1 Tax=Malonomonas rubra DSM 5091 TaxID=1122189 RepID=A0A1M6K8J1_MALRU|nr:LysE family transporter [Malonomonas rubra]SHJ55150.1 resistance to homoserine/threonine (RhtB) family protein [Malonomonas rubra DSM 5091]